MEDEAGVSVGARVGAPAADCAVATTDLCWACVNGRLIQEERRRRSICRLIIEDGRSGCCPQDAVTPTSKLRLIFLPYLTSFGHNTRKRLSCPATAENHTTVPQTLPRPRHSSRVSCRCSPVLHHHFRPHLRSH